LVIKFSLREVVGDNWKLAKALVRAKIEAPLAEDFWKGGVMLGNQGNQCQKSVFLNK
jgi:hypothetical protein